MKKTFSLLVPLWRAGLLFGVLALCSPTIYGQCSCLTDPITGNPVIINTMPGPYNYLSPQYDADGYVTSYSHIFQFPCAGHPLNLVESFTYKIIYREKGTTEWTAISDDIGPGDLLLGVGGLEPCTVYEMRVTCPECPYVPFQIVCDSYQQLQNYLNDPSNTYNNVSAIWEVCYDGVSGRPINNFAVASVDLTNNQVLLTWDNLPVPATYEISYKKHTDPLWTNAGTTTDLSFTLGNLSPCTEYDVRVRGSADCCGSLKYGAYYALNFVMADCMSMLDNISLVTGNSATVDWNDIGPAPAGYMVEWWPTATPSAISTAYTTVSNYTLTGLIQYKEYAVKVTSICGAQTCNGPSQIWKFKTNCELREPNNSLFFAAPIAFDANIGDNNISPAGDVDYFKFTPTGCDLVEIKVDHPDIDWFPNPDPVVWAGNDLPYKLYDQNFQVVPQAGDGYVDDQNRWHENVHWVTPGQTYYLEVKGWLSTWENLNCYTINAFPCYGCDDIAQNAIFGKDKVFTVPSVHPYSFQDPAFHVAWGATGPAILQPNGERCKLFFNDVGTVVLTGTITRCDGSSATFQKEITVSDECNLEGVYTVGASNVPISQVGFNYLNMNTTDYSISLDIPAGIQFSVYLVGGNASWVIDGTKIIVHQVSALATFRIVLTTGDCYGVTGIYTFFRGGDYPPYPPDFPVEWLISPNPAAYAIQINPVISPQVNPTTLPQSVDIRLFNQFSALALYQQGTTTEATTLNVSNLTPGAYTLQLIYGAYLQQYNVIKQ